jgi:hypothetical protein
METLISSLRLSDPYGACYPDVKLSADEFGIHIETHHFGDVARMAAVVEEVLDEPALPPLLQDNPGFLEYVRSRLPQGLKLKEVDWEDDALTTASKLWSSGDIETADDIFRLLFSREVSRKKTKVIRKETEAALRKLALVESEVSSSSASAGSAPEKTPKPSENLKRVTYSTRGWKKRVPKQGVVRILSTMANFENPFVNGVLQVPDGLDNGSYHHDFIAKFIGNILAGEGLKSPLVDGSNTRQLWGSNDKIDFIVKPRNETIASYANLVTFAEVKKKDVGKQRGGVLQQCMNRAGKILQSQPQRVKVIFLALDAGNAILGTATLKTTEGREVRLILEYEVGQIW